MGTKTYIHTVYRGIQYILKTLEFILIRRIGIEGYLYYEIMGNREWMVG